VPLVNGVFTPSAEEITYYPGLLTTMADAARQGTAAVMYRGAMVDIAMVKTAQQVLAFARTIGATE
jgi:citrate lyase subunit beta/citryl-CoA lyase